MITHDKIPAYYDWLSRYVQISNWVAYGERFAAFTMHKSLAVPGEPRAGSSRRTTGVEYANLRLLEVARDAGLPARPLVLDAGCGFGGTIFSWHQWVGGRYDGLSLSQVQVRVAEREARRRGVADQCRFHVASYDDPRPGNYDAVVAIESLLHSANLDTTALNLAGVLRPGGLLLVLDDMATCDLDTIRPADAALVRSHWGCSPYPTYHDFRGAIERGGLAVIYEEDLSPLMGVRSPTFLARQERLYRFLHRAIPVPPVRTVVSAFLGGVALERLHGSGHVEYRLVVARKGDAEGT
jgi:SAM-dependent methyltransferase